jgi:uncharacterized protein YjbI with pentapeptide repeats
MDGLLEVLALLLVRTWKQFFLLIASVLLGSVSLFFGCVTVLASETSTTEPVVLYAVITLLTALVAVGFFIRLIISRIQDVRSAIATGRDNNAASMLSQLRSSNKLSDEKKSSLAGVNWAGADLHQTDLSNANLCNSALESANLRKANLSYAHLRSARLAHADLRVCDLRHAVLCYARLQGADLRGAQLEDADLSAADLLGARLTGACLHGVHFDQHTRLPDGCTWTPTTNLERFGVIL